MSGVQSIERAFAVLRVLSTGARGVTGIAERTGLPKSTVARLLSALEGEGAVEQIESGGDYLLGSTLVELAGSVAPDASIGAIVQPFLADLAEQTSGSAGFTVRQGHLVLWVANVDAGDEAVHVSDLTGQTFELHDVPTGVAVLSTLADAEVDAYLDGVRATSTPGASPVDVARLRAQIADARARGVVTSLGDLIPDVNGFAAPLRDGGRAVGGLYVQGPSFRFPERNSVPSVESLLLTAARQINERLAHR